ncbi:MAG: DUF4382 domain-containing protein [Candidatus Bathyarchaeota archaeon]|nr:MAG: DUF4382 domain-containing protein [Candidatus Bathyarchaeota archaeon]
MNNVEDTSNGGHMAHDARKTFFYGATGVLIAVLIIAAVVSSPMISLHFFPPVKADTGVLTVKVTDAPVPDLKHLNLTIDGVEVKNETGSWTSIPILSGEESFDLLELENVTRDLAIGELPAGNYSKIRMQIVSANATLMDDTNFSLNVPPGHTDIHVRFEIEAGNTTSLIIDIIVDKIQIAERGESGKPAHLNPQFKAIVIPP